MKNISIKPLRNQVLIQPEKAEQKTATGIALPESASAERPQQGVVIAIGTSEKISVKVGQRVIYTRYGGTEIKHDGQEYLLVANKDLLAVIEG
jgi:chaperonin GroES